MFVWSDRKNQLDDKERLAQITSGEDGLNQRAMGLFPHPKEEEPRRVDFASQVKCRQLFVSMEGNEETCVMRLISQRNKSRAAVLIFRGRVLGCIYGRKEHDGNLLNLIGLEAFQRVGLEVLSSDTIIDTYKIDDKTAIAASSIFHGELYQPQSTMSVPEVFEFSLNHLLESLMPGTIILNQGPNNAAIIYTFKGKVHGIFSFEKGWLEPTREVATALFANLTQPDVQASKLMACNIWELKQFTFSLTGLEDPISGNPRSSYSSISLDYNEIDNIGKDKNDPSHKREQHEAPPINKFVAGASTSRIQQSYWKNKGEKLSID